MLRLPFHLTFFQHPHQLDTCQCTLSGKEIFEAKHTSGDTFDKAMVGMPHHLFDNIIQIFALAYFNTASRVSIVLIDRCSVRTALINIH